MSNNVGYLIIVVIVVIMIYTLMNRLKNIKNFVNVQEHLLKKTKKDKKEKVLEKSYATLISLNKKVLNLPTFLVLTRDGIYLFAFTKNYQFSDEGSMKIFIDKSKVKVKPSFFKNQYIMQVIFDNNTFKFRVKKSWLDSKSSNQEVQRFIELIDKSY